MFFIGATVAREMAGGLSNVVHMHRTEPVTQAYSGKRRAYF